MSVQNSNESILEGVAIIGMSGHFPGARNVAEFWHNQLAGIEAISHFRIEDLEVPHADELSSDPNYVPARGILEDADLFDAEFFGIYPREAELMDPQQRLFLECCWQSFEDAGYDPFAFPGAVGVFGGSSVSSYFLSRLCARPGFLNKFTGGYQVSNYLEMMGNNLDFLATRVAYKLNLRGPAYTMQAGCSTSLLAICTACQSLLTYQSDMALAGGSSITFPQKRGSLYQDGGMISPDGHCRTFDANAQGTVFGSGVAVVLLKRLDEALRDGDQVYAVIRGFAVNNDGSAKVGYTAPSVEGQARVIALAQEAAGVHPDTIGYIETHGTGTPLGDPIELAALARAFRARTTKKHFCVVGTAKTNVGHLDIAAGATALIHAAHIVRDGVFPPTLHYTSPNPKFDLENSPFYVNARREEWKTSGSPRRAGVSAFGVGGTNAHVIIEQAPPRFSERSLRPIQLLVLSARSAAALDRTTDNLTESLKSAQKTNLADAAWTLQVGRRAFPYRRTIVAKDAQEAILAVATRDRTRVQSRLCPDGTPAVYFLFPGQGSQCVNMGREIYESEPVFRETVNRCAEILRPHLGTDLRELLYPAEGASEEAKRRVTDTIAAQPAIFTVEYALSQLWMNWGVCPQAMLGHSIGEFVAACLAGVFSLDDALALVAARGRMMQELPSGGMLSVRLPESELRTRLNGHLSLAAVNSPSLCVVSGPFEALEEMELQLSTEGVACRRLVTSHAFHSAMMDSIIEPFTERVKQVRLNPPQLPYISGVTGTWITEREATDPAYWARHSRQAVRFSSGVTELNKNPTSVLLEVGPGNVLATLARQHVGASLDQTIVSSLSDGFSGQGDAAALMSALGSVWLAGLQPNWQSVHSGERRQRISLPTYPFEKKRYWFEVPPAEDRNVAPAASLSATAQSVYIERCTIEEGEPVNIQTETSAAVVNPPGRAVRVRAILAETFEELSGMSLSQADGSASFVEMGFDSLFLTQVTQALQNKLGLKITFRQLLGDQSSLDTLADYVDRTLPADILAKPLNSPSVTTPAPAVAAGLAQSAMPQVHVPAAPVTATENPTMSESGVERLMREQLKVMNELFTNQLEMLRGAAAASVAPARATDTAATSAVPSKLLASVDPSAVITSASEAPPAVAERDAKELKGYTPFRPASKGPSGELTARQRQHIDSLVSRYTKRTAGSKQKTQEYRQSLADPRVVSGFRQEWKEMIYPIISVRSQGSHLWDVDGNEYVDILNGFGPIMLGHRPDFVEKAIEKQLHEGFEIGPQTLLAGEVARAICDLTGNERATFCNTGSEAVVAAMRIARTVTGRNKVVFFAGDYHGMFDEVLVKGIKRGSVPQAVPVAPGIPREKAANVVVLEYGAPESLEWIRANIRELAAVMVEPVQSRHPDLQPVGFLKELRKITEEADTCLIFDEVVTGFRVHPGGCQALFGIRADLATYGKVLAGGMPIGVLAGKAKYMDALDGGAWQFGDDSFPEVGVTFFAGTFVRHPLTLAAVKVVLEHFKREGPVLQQQLNERTGTLVRELNNILEKNQVPTHIENFASIFYFSFPSDFRNGSLFYYHLREKGIHLLEGFPCFLTTAHTSKDIERIVWAFEETVAEMQAGGVLPEPAGKVPARDAEEQRVVVPMLQPTAPVEIPLTESQLEVWLSDQLGLEASCSYNESFTLHMRGRLIEPAFKQALQLVVARHDALGAAFSRDGDFQRLGAQLKLDISTTDLSHLAPDERQARLQQVIEEDAHTPFRLCDGPLVRAQLIQMEERYRLLIFTSHHIVCDGWSTNVLLDELSKAYNALQRGEECKLPVPMSFARYAKSQADFLSGPEGADVEKFWLEQYQEPASLLDLPTDRPRPSIKGYQGATCRSRIGGDTYNAIKKLGARQKCTLFVTLLAGFQILLSRLSTQDDIVVGIPTAGQSLLEEGSLVGHCVNFLPLRSRTTADPTASAFLEQVRQALFAAYDHQNYTYGRLVRKLAFPKDPSRLPLTEVQFNLERVGEGLQFEGIKADVDPNPKSFVNFDIFLNVLESKEGLVLDCDYNTGLFDEATIARWLRHYETLLLGMVANINQPISALPLLDDADRRQMLVSWNTTLADYDRNTCVHQLIEAQVQATPEAVAVVFENQELTYAELNKRADRLAAYLQKLGVKPGSMVGVFLDRSLDMIVALLGVMKSGGAYVPMDPTYPAERISFVLADANVPVLLTQEKLAQNLATRGTRVLCLDTGWEAIEREILNIPPAPVVTSDDLAYVIYTSGSTGKPKGVEISHRAVVNLLNSMRKKPGIEAQDVLLAVTTLSFDIAGLELYLPLCAGAKLVIASREAAADGNQLLARLAASKATVMQATPVTWKLLLEAGWDGTPRLKVLCGGEAFPRELANDLVKRASSVWNMYGPTETTIWSATCEVKAGDGPVLIGPPIDNTQFYVFDTHGQLSPIGVPGELYIGGDGLARGYFHRPELTAEKFIHNPFSRDGNAHFYRTGDLVRRSPDGTLEFLGRLDHQVKLRGFRIELGEIEMALIRYPGVREAVVTVREDVPGDKRLVAYLTSDQQALSVTALREFLTGKLPNYMLPAAVVRMDSMPLTPNGKIDRKALPAPETNRSTRGREFVAARTEQEKMLADIWSQVLHLERVGIQDNLFELGADSLHIFQIAARADKAGIKIAPAQFLRYRTIASLLAQLDSDGAPAKTVTPKIVPVSRQKYLRKELVV